MPKKQRRELFPRIVFSTEAANTILGIVVAKIYLDTPQKYGYPVFAAYYFRMAYEFYWYVKANWRVIWYGEEVNEEDEDEEDDEDDVPEDISRPRLIEYPPPVDTDDEDANETDDDKSSVVVVELPDDWDDSDDEYHASSEML